MDTLDDFLTRKIKNDRCDISVDDSPFSQYHSLVNMNAVKSNIAKNSIFSFLSDFFNPKFLLVKLSFISILLFFILGNKGNFRHKNYILNCDTTSVNTTAFDSLSNINNQFGDSLFH